jgi:chemotaxis protein MotB
MRSVKIALAGALMVSGLVGCRNRVADERDELWRQARNQQEELDRRNAELEAMRRAQAEKDALAAQTPAPAPAIPAPAPTPAPSIGGLETTSDANAGTVTVNLPGEIFFDSGAATIKASAKPSLDKVAAALKSDYAGKQVKVEGHTDADPIKKSKWKSNKELSEARAKAVRDYLASKGVSQDNLSTIGHGAEQPKGADKARNRRVEVVVLVDANAPAALRNPSWTIPTSPSDVKPTSAKKTVDRPELNK